MASKFVLAFLVSCLIASGLRSPAHAEADGTWSCKLDGKEWKDSKGGASLNAGMLTLYSSDDRVEGIYIMTLQPGGVGSFPLNQSAQASYSDNTGANHKSKHGTGTLLISKYSAPAGETKGKVEGTFSGTFGAEKGKAYALNDCTFSLPVKNL